MSERDQVEDAVDQATEPPHKRKWAHQEDVSDDPGELRREQRDEMDAAVGGGPGLPAMTQGQSRGLVVGSLVGGAIGALLLAPIGLIDFGGLAVGWRVLIAALAGALGGGTAGAVYLMGRVPELEGEAVDADGRPSSGTSMRDPHTDERGRHHDFGRDDG